MNSKAKQRRQRSERGFTLLEVMVAVVILGLGYVAVLQSFSLSLTNIGRLENSKRSTMAAAIELDGLLAAPAGEAAVAAGQVYLEGRRHRVMLVSSADGELVTLKLVRNY